ncbi:alpha/beta-hydrolase [Testicularia cyperi]|uniref:Alpha/beta-hydrolase n=1 Tax=Testicularia cyperi TaxID=1882483 RepID=A0A317XXF1_9BASI|nr:alpha/beta-hydrolase [Testicularia cyperi]
MEYLQHLHQVFVEPLLCHLNLAAPGGGDPTFGRENIPYSEAEHRLIYSNPKVSAVRRKVLIPSHSLLESGSWDKEKWSWVTYYIWSIPEAHDREQLHSDIVLVHGINDYAGKLAPHALHFMERGFRVIAIDLPSFGRSTGLHGHLPSMKINARAMHAVVMDVRTWDEEEGVLGVAGRERKLFAEGHSMGGFTALYYAALYPPLTQGEDGGPDLALKQVPSQQSKAISEEEAVEEALNAHERTSSSRSSKAINGANGTNGSGPEVESSVELNPPPYRPSLSGVAVAAPMITISAHSRPSVAIEYIAKVLRFFAGRLPLASAIKGNVSDDPRVEKEFETDPMTYKGKVRISTGLAILDGIDDLAAKAHLIQCPIAIHHGENDRVTDPKGSLSFFERISTKPDQKTIKIWPGYEHVMMKHVQGMSEDDSKKTKAVLHEIADWLVAEARK